MYVVCVCVCVCVCATMSILCGCVQQGARMCPRWKARPQRTRPAANTVRSTSRATVWRRARSSSTVSARPLALTLTCRRTCPRGRLVTHAVKDEMAMTR